MGHMCWAASRLGRTSGVWGVGTPVHVGGRSASHRRAWQGMPITLRDVAPTRLYKLWLCPCLLRALVCSAAVPALHSLYTPCRGPPRTVSCRPASDCARHFRGALRWFERGLLLLKAPAS